MLRTFDDLGFRQEQRFHLELGLLKLVHLQRLLPVEDCSANSAPSTQRPTPRRRPLAATARAYISAPPRQCRAPAPLAASPFEH